MKEKLIESNRPKIIKGIRIIIFSSIGCFILSIINFTSLFITISLSKDHIIGKFPAFLFQHSPWFIPFVYTIFIVWGVWLATNKFFPDSNKLILISGRLLRITSVFYLLISTIKVITITIMELKIIAVFDFEYSIFFVTGFFYLATLLYSTRRHVLALLACCFIAYKVLWWIWLGSYMHNLFLVKLIESSYVAQALKVSLVLAIFNGIMALFFLFSALSTVKKYAS